jgi:hypothetical protein
MITAYLIGDQQLLERLRALPGIVNSGLVRGITRLGIDLQRTLQQDSLGGQLRSRARPPNLRADLRVEQSGGTITASVCTDLQNVSPHTHGRAGTTNVRASLRHKRGAFVRPIAKKAIGAPTSDRGPGLPERSFLRSALDSMTPAVRDEVETTLGEAISQ